MEVTDLKIVCNTHSDYIKRPFGYCTIEWKIVNFCLATCGTDWILNSAEFYIRGPQTTKWRMFLIPNSVINERFCIELFLERIEHDGPKTVCANWKSSLLDNEGKEICKTECEYYFDKKSTHSVNLQSVNFVLDKLRPFDLDVLGVKCQLVVNDKDPNRQWENTDSIGLRSLSQDLSSLFKCSKFYDVVFRIDGKDIRVHKSIIQSRNSKLSGLIEEHRGKKIIPLEVDFEAMENIISYLYSGNLEFVLSKPTIVLYECALLLDIEEIKKYFIEENVLIRTEIEVEEYIFIWLITDFNSKYGECNNSRYGECILSPILNKGMSDVSWQFILYPTGAGHDTTYMSIYAEIVEGTLGPLDVCLEFGIMASNREIFWLKRLRKSFEVPEVLRIYDFAKRDSFLFGSLLTDNTLRIVIKIRMATRGQIVRICDQSVTLSTPSKMKTTYGSLSSDLAGMFENGKFRDITLLAEGKQFKVHKCILAARSKVFASMLKQLREGEATMNIPSTKPNILRIALNYMYSGFMRDFDLYDILEVYDLTISFEISSLKEICVQALQETITLETVCDILVFADDKKEMELKTFCLKFICRNASTVFDQVIWKRFIKTKPALSNEVEEYLKNNFHKRKSSAETLN